MTSDNRDVHAFAVFWKTSCLALLLSSVSVLKAETVFGPDIDTQCPQAVSEAIALHARRNPPKLTSPVTRPALRANLLFMAKQDQDVRQELSPADTTPASPKMAQLLEVDAANLARMKHIIHQDGFPTAEMVGLDGVNAAWLLTLHAGRDAGFQEKVLGLVLRHSTRGEVRSDQVAMLTDDVLAARGKPQRYGTNFEMRDGELRPATMEDEANVDERRRAVGLGTLANYACVMRAEFRASRDSTSASSSPAR